MAQGPLANHTLFDNIIHGILGHPTDEYAPAKAKEIEADRAGDRKKANQMALSAMDDPGGAYMSAPSLGGGGTDILKMVGNIAKFFGGAGL